MGTYKNIIFDMDGTLFDSEPIHALALQKKLQEFAIEVSHDELEIKYAGLDDTQVYWHFAHQINGIGPDEFVFQKNQIYLNLINNLTTEQMDKALNPGCIQLLQHLQECKIPTALVSSSEYQVVQTMMDRFNLRKYFKFIYSRGPTFFLKPNPSPYLMAMRRLNAQSIETAIFEDSPPGLKAAAQTGARVIQVTKSANIYNLFNKLDSEK